MYRLLDLFCCAGGAATGYSRAGFHVIGIDRDPQKRYPFTFIQGDALEFLRRNAQHFDAIHASPPCQRFARPTHLGRGRESHPDLIAPVRELLIASGKPFVIENVPGAPLNAPIVLCGAMFGLQVIRHRQFESNVPIVAPEHRPHQGGTGTHRWPYAFSGYYEIAGTGQKGWTMPQGRAAMGIDWPMVRRELVEAIPPAYTEYIGRQLVAHIQEETK